MDDRMTMDACDRLDLVEEAQYRLEDACAALTMAGEEDIAADVKAAIKDVKAARERLSGQVENELKAAHDAMIDVLARALL